MKRFLFFLLPLPILFFAQEINWNLMGSGARAMGMGGAFISVADDASSILWNPAGIAQLIKPEISFCGSFRLEDWSTAEGYSDYSYTHFLVDHASVVLPFSLGGGRVVFSFAYHPILDWYRLDTDTISEYWGDYLYYRKLSGPFSSFAPALGFNMGQFSLGASFDLWKFGPKYYEYEKYDSAGFAYEYEYNEKNNPSSIGINLGALYTSEMFRFGGVIRLPHTLKQHIEWEKTMTGDINYDSSGTIEGSEIGFPMMFGFGGSVILANALTIALDYEIRPYSKMTINGATYTNVYDCNQLRVGLEYMFNIEKFALPLRVGYMTDPKTYADKNGHVVGNAFTGGMGFVFDRISFDIATYYMFSNELYEGMSEEGTYTRFHIYLSTAIRL
uniref:PorV/PorQ family protein n=1 Tax=candidate division WOR-3 bacterium TaxID=2052148 RepID=A0A7C4UCW6_UNCW3